MSILKKYLKIIGRCTRYIPFINSIRLGSAIMDAKHVILYKCRIRCSGHGNKIYIGKGCILRSCSIIIKGNNNVVVIDRDVHATNAEIWIEDDNNQVSIGANTDLCGRIHLACIEGQRIEIGEKCLCSSEIVVRTGDSHSLINLEGNRINPSAPVKIGDHVWIGYRVLINKGVSIKPNSVIGTGAIVTHSFDEEGVCIAGVPAKIVKRNINWDSKRLPVGE